MEAPLTLPLPLMALFNAMVAMPSEHNTLVLMEDVTFGLQVEYLFVSKDNGF